MFVIDVFHHDIHEMLFIRSVVEDEDTIATFLAIYPVFGVRPWHVSNAAVRVFAINTSG